MREKIRSAIAACESDPVTRGQPLRALIHDDEEGVLRDSASLLRAEPEFSGREQLLKALAASDGVVSLLCKPDLFCAEESVELARLLAGVDPQLETKLLRMMPRSESSADQATIERVLSLLEAISASARIVPALAHLLHDSNPRLRAKAALMIGRRVQNSQFVEGRLQEKDARVRANAIESLWGEKSLLSSAILWEAVKDPHNRVAGNALVALYQSHDRGAIPHILAMAGDSRHEFRATAAWIMAKTADPRFLPAVEKLARDLYASVRRNAAVAVEKIRERPTAEVRFTLNVLRVEQPRDGMRSLSLQVLESGGAPVRGLLVNDFIVWRAQTPVTEYEVVEHDASERVGAGFALCLDGAERAVAGCLTRKPPGHLWSIAKFSSGAPSAPSAIAMPAYVADPATLQAALTKPALEMCPFRTLLPGLFAIEGDRRLILLAGPDLAPPPEAEPLMASAFANNVAIHAVIVGQPSDAWKAVCSRTGGVLMAVGNLDEAGGALGKLYAGLSNCYRIRYRMETDGAESAVSRIEAVSDVGRGECSA